MTDFISEENRTAHAEYYGRMLARISVYEREYPELSGKPLSDIMRLCRRLRGADEISELYADAHLHRVFFGSYSGEGYQPSHAARELFGSEAAMRDKIFKEAMRLPYGFVAVVRNSRGAEVIGSESGKKILSAGEPLLALDVCEHAYYGDWGFNKEGYLRAALFFMRLTSLDGIL